MNVKSGAIFPATFEDKGPDQPLRGLRNFIGDQAVSYKLREEGKRGGKRGHSTFFW